MADESKPENPAFQITSGDIFVIIIAFIAAALTIDFIRADIGSVYTYADVYGGVSPDNLDRGIVVAWVGFFMWLTPDNFIAYIKHVISQWKSTP